MENSKKAPTHDFLDIMVQICYELDETPLFQTELFIRICALHQH